MRDRKAEVRVPLLHDNEQVLRRIGTAQLRQAPDFIILGAQKGGTTSLRRYLRRHPDVGTSSTKEVHYFSWRYQEGMDWYLARFPVRGKVAIVGESSPSYLLHPQAAERANKTLPRVKLIALLRNPVDRAYSHYQMNIAKGIEPLSFEDAVAAEPERLRENRDWSDDGLRKMSYISYLTRGLYADQLHRWFDVYPREQMLVVKSEEFLRDSRAVFARTLDFLGLEVHFPEQFEVHNAGVYDDMRPETRARLTEHFAPHNQQLYDLLGRDFGWEHE